MKNHNVLLSFQADYNIFPILFETSMSRFFYKCKVWSHCPNWLNKSFEKPLNSYILNKVDDWLLKDSRDILNAICDHIDRVLYAIRQSFPMSENLILHHSCTFFPINTDVALSIAVEDKFEDTTNATEIHFQRSKSESRT